MADASSNSLSADSADGNDAGGLRASMDGAIGRMKDRARRHSVDDRRGSDDTTASSSSKRLSSLVPRSRRLSRKDKPDLERDLSAHSIVDDTLTFTGSRSETASILDESRHSSIFTDDGSDDGYV